MGKRPNGRKPGRPVDPVLDALRSTWLPTRSARTHARYKAALELLSILGATPEQIAQAVADTHRPNGSLNVNLLVRYAEWLVRQAARDRRPDDDEDRPNE
jgi:hypothetical protein